MLSRTLLLPDFLGIRLELLFDNSSVNKLQHPKAQLLHGHNEKFACYLINKYSTGQWTEGLHFFGAFLSPGELPMKRSWPVSIYSELDWQQDLQSGNNSESCNYSLGESGFFFRKLLTFLLANPASTV